MNSDVRELTNLLLFLGFKNINYLNIGVFVYEGYTVNIKYFDTVRIINNEINLDVIKNPKSMTEFLKKEFLYEIRKAKIKQILDGSKNL